MKKLAYLTLIAAFAFGMQPQEAFSADSNALEMRKGGKSQAKIEYDNASESLTIYAESPRKERAAVVVYFEGKPQIKREFLINGELSSTKIDLSGFHEGIYTVKIVSKTIEFKDRFKKH